MARRKKRVEHKIRLYPGQGDDDELIRWMALLDDLPWGEKSQRVKQALLRGIGNDHSGESTVTPATFDLAEIRQVVEAATESALGRFGGRITVGDDATDENEEEVDTLLDNMGATLTFGGDEDE